MFKLQFLKSILSTKTYFVGDLNVFEASEITPSEHWAMLLISMVFFMGSLIPELNI